MRQELIWRGAQAIENMERETGLEPVTSSLGIRISIVNRGFRRSRRSFLVKEVFYFQWRPFKSHLNEVIKVTDPEEAIVSSGQLYHPSI